MTLLLFSYSLWASAHEELQHILEEQTPQSWKQHLTISSDKNSTVQELLFYGLQEDDLFYTRIEIQSPAKWKGIRVAQIDIPEQQDPYWIYLPALKRVNTVKKRTQTPLGIDLTLIDFNLNTDDQVEKTESGYLIKRENETVNIVLNQNQIQSIERTLHKEKITDRLSFIEWIQQDGYLMPAELKLKLGASDDEINIIIKTLEVNLPSEKLPKECFNSQGLLYDFPCSPSKE